MPARVLQVLEATIGGTKRHVLDLAAGLRRRGWEIEVACPRVRDEHHGDVSFWDDLAALGVIAHEVPMTRSPATVNNACASWQLAGLIRRRHYAIVHAQSSIAGAFARPAALLAGLARQKPGVVYSPHGFAFLSDEWGAGPQRAAFLGAERLLAHATDRLIAVSPTEAEQAVTHGIARHDRIAVIPNGVVHADVPAVRRPIGELLPELARWDEAPLVGTLARMSPQKDPLTWLRVAARVHALRPEARFIWIWGGGALEKDVYDETDRLGLRQHISFLGHRPDARALFGALDVFLLTSRFEGLPYSAIEALAAGTPVVATNVSGTRDVVRHDATGLLAPQGDVEALASGVVRLLDDDSLRRQFGEAGRLDVLGRFSVDEMVDHIAALYAALIAR